MSWMLNLFLFIANTLFVIRRVKTIEENENRDFIKQKSVEEFKRLCPFTDLCHSKAKRNVTELPARSFPCCSPCACNVTGVSTACPDKPERYMNEAEVFRVKQAPGCIYAQFRRYNSYKMNGKSYEMIGYCPAKYKNAEITGKCSQDFQEFNFDKDDVTTLMPVYSESLNVTFKNYFCVICHGATQEKLHFWKTQIECQKEKSLLLSNIYEIPSKLLEEPQCQLIFLPPPAVPVQECDGIIDRCNVTGAWPKHDLTLESACFSYFSEYIGYKNIHCYLCNGHTFTDINDECFYENQESKLISFVALLDFNNLEGPSDELQICPRSSNYDSYTKKCRPMSCPHGMMLAGDRCVPLFSKLDNDLGKGTVFGLRINLFPTKILGWRHLDLVASTFSTEIFFIKIPLVKTYQVSFCSFHSFIKLKHSLEEVVFYMGLGNTSDIMPFVSHLSIAADFNIESLRNISETLEEMATLFTVNDNYAHYSIQYPADIQKLEVNSFEFENVSAELIENLEALKLDSHEYKMFTSGMNDPNDGLGILWFLDDDLLPIYPPQECKVAISIQPQPFCPRIEFPRSEFDIDITRKRITATDSNSKSFNLCFSKILSTKLNRSVLVCIEEYLSQLPSGNKNTKVNYTLFILTIVCIVPSIVSLLLSFLAYCLLPKLRNIPGLNNMALVFHLLLAQVLVLVNTFTNVSISKLCSAIGVVLHYTLLASFVWTFICTFHMTLVFVQIKERTSSDHQMRKFVLYLLFAEIIPAVIVVLHVAINVLADDNQSDLGYGGSNCYIKDSKMILYFVAVPLGVILLANLAMFTFVVCRVARLPNMAKNNNRERKNILIFAKLSTITGLTWIFGFLYQFFEVILLAYFYIVYNAGQGVFIMLSFVVNKRVLDMLHERWREKSRNKSESINQPVTLSSVTGNGTSANSTTKDTEF